MSVPRWLRSVAWALLLPPLGAVAPTVASEMELREEAGTGEELAELSDREIETILLEGRVVDRQNLEVGVTLPERLWVEFDGHRMSAAFKSMDYERLGLTYFENAPPELNFKDSFRYERAAFVLDRLLDMGMVPVAVLRRVKGQEGALVAWVEDSITEQERLRLGLAPEDTDILIRQRADMRVFDALTYNLDNNLGNQLWTTRDWKLHLIDHTRSFRQQKNLPQDFVERPVSLTPGLYRALRSLEESQIRETLKAVLSPGEIRTLLGRLELILEKIEQDRRDYGDEFVLFDLSPPAQPR